MLSKQEGKIIILSGPSGSGKTTLHKALLKDPALKQILIKSVSATTRPMRPGEKRGKDYFFLTRPQFESRITKGYFLEWEKVCDNYYGTSKRQVLGLLGKGKNVLLCIDVKGARNVRQEFPRTVGVFIKTPSMKVLRERLSRRASESPEGLKRRLDIARAELKEAGQYEHVITNGRLDKARRELKRIIVKILAPEGNAGASGKG